MRIEAKNHSGYTRDVTFPQGPKGSTWRCIFDQAWATTRQLKVGTCSDTAASKAEWRQLEVAIRQLDITPNGLRPTGYNLWRSRGLASDVVNRMGAWAPGSKVPERHYMRVKFLDPVFKAAARPSVGGNGM